MSIQAILKIDEEKRQAFGWASIAVRVDGETVVDFQQDILLAEDLEQAAYEYVALYGSAGEMHLRKDVAKLIESVVFTEEKAVAMGIPTGIVPQGGWWVGYHVEDEAVWEKIKSGEYAMFSIEGIARRRENGMG